MLSDYKHFIPNFSRPRFIRETGGKKREDKNLATHGLQVGSIYN
jgi:hypothetical protein